MIENRKRICYYTSPVAGEFSAREVARRAVNAGVGALEMMSFCEELKTPDRDAAREIGRFVKQHGLAIPCFSVGSDFLGEDLHEKIACLKEYARICSELEIPLLHHTVVTPIKEERLTASRKDLMRLAVEAALEVNEAAAALGVRTIVENQGLVVNGVEGYVEFLKKTEGRIGMLLDVGNIEFLDETATELLDSIDCDVCHVHLKDYRIIDTPVGKCYGTAEGRYLSPCAIGGGDLPLRETLTALEQRGYGGYYSLEFPSSLGAEGAERSIQFVLDQLENK